MLVEGGSAHARRLFRLPRIQITTMLARFNLPTPAPSHMFTLGGIGAGSNVLLPGDPSNSGGPEDHGTVKPAIDPTTLAINECIALLLAMRKAQRHLSGVAALLGGDFFGEDDDIMNNGSLKNLTTRQSQGDPLTLSFMQLRLMLTSTDNIYSLDSLTLLQPFLMVIKAPQTSGHITRLALNAVLKFLTFQIISVQLRNLQQALIQVVSALCKCRFEQGDQNLDDAVLLKVLRLLEIILELPLSNMLSNELILEVVQVCWLLAINKRRSEVLRRAAEMAMEAMTFRIFSRLAQIPASRHDDDLTVHFDPNSLPKDTIGACADGEANDTSDANITSDIAEATEESIIETKEGEAEKDTENLTNPQEEPFGILAINDFLTILVLMIAPGSQYSNMELTRVFALLLINTAIEVAGRDILNHPALLGVVADPVFKHTLQIIATTESSALLQALMQLLTTIAIVMGHELKPQMELALKLIFESILASSQTPQAAVKAQATPNSKVIVRLGLSKEILLELLSLLWTRDPRKFFVNLFIYHDCDFEKLDLAHQVVDNLCKLALPELAQITTDNVPPICLEGILLLVFALNEQLKRAPKLVGNSHSRLDNRARKTAFVQCTHTFNKKPKDGIAKLVENGFISSATNNKELAEFFLSKLGRLNKKILGEYLAKPTSKQLLQEFIGLLDFTNMRVDEAIRILLKTFRLPGESQQIERIVELFAERYVECYTDDEEDAEEGREPVRPDRDSVFILLYSIIMLNTDLHNPQVKKQMLLADYQRNLRGQCNGKDYPEWYLSKIYNLIKDREIIMPEEHHGTDKWFDDVWNNVVQAETKTHGTDSEVSPQDQAQFDRAFFDSIASKIFETLFLVFGEASDDHVITRIMLAVDKCANICLHYLLKSHYELLVEMLCKCTHLLDSSIRVPVETLDDDLRESIPLTQVTIEDGDDTKTITVGTLSVWFGRDFKAQISTVVLFRLLKKVGYALGKDDLGKLAMRIILTLYENCLVDSLMLLPDSELPTVKPKYIISKIKSGVNNLGILLTFSSFLKGYGGESQPEPTAAEIDATMSTLDCVSLLQLSTIFERMLTTSKKVAGASFVDLFLSLIPTLDDSTKRYFEAELMLLLQLSVQFASTEEEIVKVLAAANEIKGFSKQASIKVITLKLKLTTGLKSTEHQQQFAELILKEIQGVDKEFLAKNGDYILDAILKELPRLIPMVLHLQDYWKVLRVLGSLQQFSGDILDFIERLCQSSQPENIDPNNFMFILGLLDEISLMGALGAAAEQQQELPVPKGEKRPQPTQAQLDVVTHAKRLICLTAELAPITKRPDFAGLRYSLLQALAHQCFNPCREVRGFSMGVLRSTILATELEENSEDDSTSLTAFGLFEYGLFPLLVELCKVEVIETDRRGFVSTQIESLSLVSKVFLQYCATFTAEKVEQVWLYILDNFVAMRKQVSEDSAKDFDEAAPELLKNMVLVLQSNNILKEDDRLSNLSWSKIGDIYPELPNELKKEPKTEQADSVEKAITESKQEVSSDNAE